MHDQVSLRVFDKFQNEILFLPQYGKRNSNNLLQSVYQKYNSFFDFRAKQILKMKMKNEKLLKFVLFLNRIILLVHGLIRVPKYNLFFDLKTKQILKIFHFSFFNFIT